MQTYTANQAKTQFAQFVDAAQYEPVQVLRHNRVVGVMVSARDYAEMQQFYAERAAVTLNQTSSKAKAAGLTQAALNALLADES